MTSHPPRDDKHVSPMEKIFDFSVRPGVACVKPEIAKRLTDAYKKGQAQEIAEMATPPESDWSAEDLANQKRIADDIERALERHYAWMVVWICVAGVAIAVAIHFLGKQ